MDVDPGQERSIFQIQRGVYDALKKYARDLTQAARGAGAVAWSFAVVVLMTCSSDPQIRSLR